jgi:hypothetical protein
MPPEERGGGRGRGRERGRGGGREYHVRERVIEDDEKERKIIESECWYVFSIFILFY